MREDLTNKEDSHLALTVTLTKKKKFNISIWYRQWQEVNEIGKIPGTKSIKAQKTRLQKTANYVQKSISEGETWVLSDTNINTIYLNSPDKDKSQGEKQITPVTNLFKNDFLEKGLTILNKKKHQTQH